MAHLLVLKGPNRGERLHIIPPRTVLGREADCDIVLDVGGPDDAQKNAVSRKHAVIAQIDGHSYIFDGDGNGRRSHNRILVNGELVPFHPARVRLKHEDVIKICNFTFVFHDEDSSSVVDGAISHDSSIFIAQSALRLKALLEITNRLNTLDLDVLLPDVVETLLQLFKQADRAFLILVDEATGTLVPHSCKVRDPAHSNSTDFSISIVAQCLSTVNALRVNDAKEQYPGSDSIDGLSLRSVMCAPLWSQDNKGFGALMIDTRNDRTKFTDEDLNLLMGVASQASIAVTNARFYQDSLIKERYEADHELARQVVRSFLPAEVPTIPGYDFFACYESALEVGGDYYDFVPLPGQRLGVLVGDVAGKGVPAALVMTRFSAEARTCLRTEGSLTNAICRINTLMQVLGRMDRFVTFAALILDPATHTLTVVNAGHPPPLLLHRGTTTVEEVSPRAAVGPPLGIVDGYAYESRQITLAPGDRVVVFSDGVSEAPDLSDQQFGATGLHAVLAQAGAGPSRALGERILQAVKDHSAGCGQQDDITLVCFGRTH